MYKPQNVLQYDKRIEESQAKLKAMGVVFHVETVGQNECYTIIDMKSIVRLIDRRITYPKRRTYLEGDMMIIKFWKGEELV